MANVNDLGLIDEKLPEVNPADLPEQEAGTFLPLPQPGAYTFRLPADVSDVWEVFQTDEGQRVRAVFKGTNSMILETAAGTRPLMVRLTNRLWDMDGTKVCELAFLAQALGHGGSLKSNKDYIAVINAHPNARFMADVEWNCRCSPDRDAVNEAGEETGKKGCGQEYRLRPFTRKNGTKVKGIPQNGDGSYCESFICSCGARLRAFSSLTRIRKPQPE